MPITLALAPPRLCCCPSPRTAAGPAPMAETMGLQHQPPSTTWENRPSSAPCNAAAPRWWGKACARLSEGTYTSWLGTDPSSCSPWGSARAPGRDDGAEPTALQLPQAGPMPQMRPQAGARGWKGNDMQPKLCLTWSPETCKTQQLPTAPGSSLGHPLHCCSPICIHLPEPQAGAGVRPLPRCRTGQPLQPPVPFHKRCLKCRHQIGTSCEGLAIAGGTLDPASSPVPWVSHASSAQAVPEHPWSTVP